MRTAQLGLEHDFEEDDDNFVCVYCGKTIDEIEEQENPILCFGEED